MKSQIIVALDMNFSDAFVTANKLDPSNCKLKIGSQLFSSEGPKVIEEFTKLGFEIFLDLKFHDIPHTVNRSIKELQDFKIWMINVHASGGAEMLSSAVEAISEFQSRPILLGVTVLTSLNDLLLKEIGIKFDVISQVLNLAQLSKTNGLDGVVCSPNELTLLRRKLGDDFVLVTPGVRSNKGTQLDDQKRTATLKEALERGADFVVIGREITKNKNPTDALDAVLKEIEYIN